MNKIDKRFTRPQTLSSAFGSLIKIFKNKFSDVDLINNLEKIIGETSKIIQISSIKKQKDGKFYIIIKPIDNAFIIKIQYQKDEILNKINNYYKINIISKIIIKSQKN